MSFAQSATGWEARRTECWGTKVTNWKRLYAKGAKMFRTPHPKVRPLRLVATTLLAIFIVAHVARAEDGAARLQRTLDDADQRIREIVRELAKPGLSGDTRARLTKEKENQEWVRAQAQMALFKERESGRRPEQAGTRMRAELIAWQDAAEVWAKEWKNFQRDLRIHQQDVTNHAQALNEFERLPVSQQSRSRAEALNRWARSGNDRRDRLLSWHRSLERKRTELLNRYRTLESQVFSAP